MWGNTLCSAAAQSAPWTALVSPRYCLRRCLRLNSLASTRGTNTVTSCCSVDHHRPLEQCSAANAVVLRPIMMRALYRGLFNGRCQVHCRIAALHRCDGHGRRLAPCRPLSVDALPCSWCSATVSASRCSAASIFVMATCVYPFTKKQVLNQWRLLLIYVFKVELHSRRYHIILF